MLIFGISAGCEGLHGRKSGLVIDVAELVHFGAHRSPAAARRAAPSEASPRGGAAARGAAKRVGTMAYSTTFTIGCVLSVR